MAQHHAEGMSRWTSFNECPRYTGKQSTSDAAEFGKPIGSDASNEKTTYVTLYGEENAREMVRRLVLEADLAVKGTVLDDKLLYDLADTLAKRKH